MDLKQIEYFLRVAERRSFSRAAEQLGIAQSSLSRQVALLEEELKQHLFSRNGRGVEPTEAGIRFMEHARALLALAERAKEDLQSLRESPSGKVAIGLPPRVAVVAAAPLLKAFRNAYPAASMTIAEGLSAQVREWLLAGRVELALLYDPPPTPQLAYESLFREDLVLVRAGTQPPLPANVKVAQLGDYPLILPSLPNAIRTLVESTCRSRGTRLNVVVEIDAVHTIVELAAMGHGCAILPRSSVHFAPTDVPLSIATITSPHIRNNLVLATPRNRPVTRLAAGTADLMRSLDMPCLFGAV